MDAKYWVAVNGSKCVILERPMVNPKVTPTPAQLFGFPTPEEAEQAHRICQQGSFDEAEKFFAGVWPDVASGRVRFIQPAHPQPWTDAPVAWTENADAHRALQQALIKPTSH
jgi:hypothetical protein